MKEKTHCIVSKKCGRDSRGTWKRSEAMTKQEAIDKAQGFMSLYPFSHALVVDYNQSVSIGLPDDND